MIMRKIRTAAALILSVLLCLTSTYHVKADTFLEGVYAGAGKYGTVTGDDSDPESAMVAVSEPVKVSFATGAGAADSSISMIPVSLVEMTEVNVSGGESDLSENAAESEPEEHDELDGMCLAEVDDAMNVRTEPTEDSSIAGYLYKNCVAQILEEGDGWTRVKSGKLEGWAKNDYLVFGDEAKQKIEETNSKVATVNTETLRVRVEADENSSITALLGEGSEVSVVSAGEDWTKISFDDGTEGRDEGYVSSDYISIGYSFLEGETIEAVQAREKKAKEEKEAAAKAAAKSKKSEKSTGKTGGSQTAAPAITNNGAVSAGVDDETLLAALIQCECGNDSYEGKLAVGAVVMNRARGAYGSISKAIYAPGQFGPASSGKLALTLQTGAISGSSRQAAQDAISGISNIGAATHFRNSRSGYAGVVVGHHVFW